MGLSKFLVVRRHHLRIGFYYSTISNYLNVLGFVTLSDIPERAASVARGLMYLRSFRGRAGMKILRLALYIFYYFSIHNNKTSEFIWKFV